MKRWIILCLVGIFMPFEATASHSLDLVKGQKIFKKKLRKKCRFSGVRFARTHTQDEWEELWDSGRFQQEAKKICPKLQPKKIKKEWWPYIYEFSHEYAKDGSHVPHC